MAESRLNNLDGSNDFLNDDNDENDANDANDHLHNLSLFRKNHPKNILLGHLNINSIRNKFDSVQELIQISKMNLLLISETKLDESFPSAQFKINGYRMFRRDRSLYGCGLCFYIDENLACKVVNHKSLNNYETICLEINTRKRKWLIIGLYKPPNVKENVFLENMSTALQDFSKTYENIIHLGE